MDGNVIGKSEITKQSIADLGPLQWEVLTPASASINLKEKSDSESRNHESSNSLRAPVQLADKDTLAFTPIFDKESAPQREPAFQSRQDARAHLEDFPLRCLTHVFKEAGKLVGKRDSKEDQKEDLEATEAYIRHPELEAKISGLTRLGLMKDADQYKPVVNADGSTTYTIVQIGLSNRPQNDGAKCDEADRDSKYYSRKVQITVPDGAVNLGECQFQYDERQQIQEKQFKQILAHDRERTGELKGTTSASSDVELYSHGVYTYSNLSDTQALLLQLTNGRPTVNIDWAAYPNTPENPNRPDLSVDSYLHYMEDRAGAKKAETELAPTIDKTINTIGAEHTVMVGFSHGGMFDARYLRHRVDSGLPKIETLVLAHPDLPIKARELHLPAHHSLLSAASSHTFVIGGQSDKQLRLSAFTPFAGGLRLGNDSLRTRRILQHDHAVPVTESDRQDPSSDQHLLNYAGVAELLNGSSRRSLAQTQNDYIQASKVGRQHR